MPGRRAAASRRRRPILRQLPQLRRREGRLLRMPRQPASRRSAASARRPDASAGAARLARSGATMAAGAGDADDDEAGDDPARRRCSPPAQVSRRRRRGLRPACCSRRHPPDRGGRGASTPAAAPTGRALGHADRHHQNATAAQRLRHRLQRRERLDPTADADLGAVDPQGRDSRSCTTGRAASVPVMCQHCAEPPCVDVCPTGASFKRADGIVLVDRHTCIGCRYCMMACPTRRARSSIEPLTGQKPDVPRGRAASRLHAVRAAHRPRGQNDRPAPRPATKPGTARSSSATSTTRQRDLAPRARDQRRAAAADLKLDPACATTDLRRMRTTEERLALRLLSPRSVPVTVVARSGRRALHGWNTATSSPA